MLHRLATAAFVAAALPVLAIAQDQTEAPAASTETAAPVDPATVLAKVGDTEITLGHLVAARSGLPEQFAQMPASVLFDGLLDQIVNQELLKQAYTGEEPDSVKVTIDNSRRSLMAAASLAEYLEANVTEEAVQKAYNDAYGDGYEPEMEYHASHVLVETEEEASDIIAQYEDGAEFAKLARDNSTGPSAPNGGDLGWMTAGMTVEPFDMAMQALEPGEISGPVQSNFGWHVIKMNETREQAPAFEDVQAELRAKVQEDVTMAYIDVLNESGNVDKSGAEGIDPAVLDSMTPQE
ncbi:peptidylprolyl isomerase [Pseudooceanicola algae]|uniref:Parvulin-like PPIase n=1 Tax=Pseudooceanicola algae TaxID=1537215 RepID=A0A418SBD2_9RHOB|nr:peptidylprolyl isomerase [Pseudooceanicola algae]QPM91428.1 Foldase protein PrsA [Pseudooceanicola algae]